MLANILFAALLAFQASAVIKPISVGRDGLTFDPNTTTAAIGDIIEFRFWARNHSVVAGHFTQGCVPASRGGFFSGFIPTTAGARNDTVFRVSINNTDPIVFYCSQNTGSHCKNGMFGTINAVTGKGIDNYKILAANASTAVSPPAVFGGALVLNPAPPNSSTTLTPTSTATATSTSTLTGTGTGTRTGTGTATGSGTTPPTTTATGGAGVKGASLVGVVGVVVAALAMA